MPSRPIPQEVCCLPGARVRDVARKLPGLVQPSDYYPLLVMQVGGDDIMDRSPKAIKRDFRAPERLAEGSGHRWCFPQYHQWQERALKGAGKLINRWLSNWCHRDIMGTFTWHQACWRQMESSYLKRRKGFLPLSWRGSLRGL